MGPHHLIRERPSSQNSDIGIGRNHPETAKLEGFGDLHFGVEQLSGTYFTVTQFHNIALPNRTLGGI